MLASYLESHGGIEVLKVGHLPNPEPGPREVRVRIKAAALNHLEIWVRKGLPNLKLKYPHILGGDAAGVVDALGSDVHGVRVGSEVIVHPGINCGKCAQCTSGWESLCAEYQILGEHISGTHAEYVVVPESNVFYKPSNLSFEEAASIPLVFTTAWQMLVRRAKVQKDQWVLVHSIGSGVSSAGIQIAKLFGAKTVATGSGETKADFAKHLGADHYLDYSKADWAKSARSIAPNGFDVIFDHTGEKFWESNIKLTKSGGTLVLCGATSGPMGTTDLRHVFFRQIGILGSTMGNKTDFTYILEWIAKGKLKPVVGKVFPLSLAHEAQKYMEARAQLGKIILSM